MAEGRGTATGTGGTGNAGGSTGAEAPADSAVAAAEEKLLKANAKIQEEALQAVGRESGRARVEVFKGKGKKGGEFYVRVVAANNEETFVSEGHKNATDAVQLAASSFPTLRLVDLTQDED